MVTLVGRRQPPALHTRTRPEVSPKVLELASREPSVTLESSERLTPPWRELSIPSHDLLEAELLHEEHDERHRAIVAERHGLGIREAAFIEQQRDGRRVFSRDLRLTGG